MVSARDLENVKLFTGVGERITTKVVALLRERTFKAGQAICHEGEPPGSMFIIRSGWVSVDKQTDKGPRLLAKLGRWNFFGEMGAVLGEPRSATVRALEPTVVLELRRQDLLDVIQTHPLIGVRVRNEIVARQTESVAKLLA